MNSWRRRIETVAERFSGRTSVAAVRLDGTDEIALNATEAVPTASAVKVPILVALHRAAADGVLSLRDRVPVVAEDVVGGSGVLRLLDPGLELTIGDLGALMTCVSDNTATNAVLRLLGGVEAVNDAMRDLGLPGIRLNGRVDLARMTADPLSFGVASAHDLRRLLMLISSGRAFSARVSRGVEETMAGQQYLDQGLRYLRLDPYGAELGGQSPLRTASKTGRMPGVRMDIGIVRFGATGYCYVIANDGSRDRSFRVDSDGSVLAGLIGRMLLEHYWDDTLGSAPILPVPASSD